MSNFFLSLSFTSLLLFSFSAQGDESEAPKSRVGPGKAVLEAKEADGIRLSEKAIRNLNLSFIPVEANSPSRLPVSALVKFQDFTAVYRKRDGWFKMVEVEPRVLNEAVLISSKDLKPGDELVVENASLLRVVDLDVWGPEADACAD